MIMERLLMLLIALMLVACVWVAFTNAALAAAVDVDWLPADNVAILNDVALQYGLDDVETRLLYVIRKVENGGAGREMGVLTQAAQRYKGDFKRSLRLQAEYAAGTIKKRFNGDLEEFAARWCPVGAENDPKGLNKHWLKNARYWMERS